MMYWLIKVYSGLFKFLEYYLGSLFLLFARVYVGFEFFQSGYSKITNWDSTLYLFENEYSVPFINWQLAAYLGTAAEIVLPILLIIGLATRLMATGLFVFNIIAVISYPILIEKGFVLFQPVLVDGRLYGAIDHQIWGILLLTIVLFGAGKIALDTLICKKYCN